MVPPGYHSPMAGQPLRVAVLGAGTVGREVVRALSTGWGQPDLELSGVAVRDLAKAEAAGMPSSRLTDAPAHLIADEADVVVELMGGEEPARTLIAAALGAGLPVVTANKYVLARHGAELERIARESGAALRYEASVMGGTPILRLLAEDLVGARAHAFEGIVNGTTNYILSEMAASGASYEAALAAAQNAGYAEADPTSDVEGGDAADKLVILARLAFGAWLDRGSVVNRSDHGKPGITGVVAEDLAAAADEGLAIRLLARARRGEERGPIGAAVRATAVDARSGFAGTVGVRNRIEIVTDRLGTITIEGPGAGGAATAAAVLADLAAIQGRRGSTWAHLPPASSATSVAPEPASWFEGPSGARYPVER
jgi:homoserine dehydrogenase